MRSGTGPRMRCPLRPFSHERVSGCALGIATLVRRNGLELLFTQILEEVLDSPMMPGIVGVLTLVIEVGQGNTHRIERWTARLLVFWDVRSLGRRRVSTTVVSKVHWIVICR